MFLGVLDQIYDLEIVLGLGVDDRNMHFWIELCCCPNLLAFALPFLPLVDLVIQSGERIGRS
jgi:hypothetical protein